MRRRLFLPAIACGIALAFGGYPGFAWNAAESQADTNTILGDWYLLASTGVNMPLHHMDLRFKNVSGELRGAIVSRVDGSEIPLASSEFDGSTLRFKRGSQRQDPI